MFKKRRLASYFCLLILVAGASWANKPANEHSLRFADGMLSLLAPWIDAKAQEEVSPSDDQGGPEMLTKAEAGLLRSLDGLSVQPAIPNPAGIGNGDFESGSVIWDEYSTHGWPLIIDSGFPGSMTPHSGSWAVWLGGEYDDISYIYQTVTLPNADNSFVDDFDSSELNPRWSWVREDPTHWSLTSNPGYMRITTQTGSVIDTSNNQKNLLLTPAPPGDFIITTRVTISPTQNYQFAALQIYQDDDNYIQLNRAYANGQTLNFDQEVAGVPTNLQITLSDTTLYLRITRTANLYTAYYSIDGSSWTQAGQYTANLGDPWIGISAANNTAGITEIPTDFDFFQLNSGPFLNYWRWIASEDSCGNDYGSVIINSTVADAFDLCTTTSTGGWVNESLDLNAYSGQTVTLQFRAETDSSLNSNLFIDDVSLSLEQGEYIYLPQVFKNYSNFNYFDDFSNPNSGWASGENATTIYRYLDGEYQIYLKQQDKTSGITPDLVFPSDYQIEVDARKVSPGVCSYGLIFGARWTADSWETYQFIVWPTDGEFYMNKRTLDGSWTTIQDWTYSSAINLDYDTNHIRVNRIGTEIRVYINGTMVVNITDSSFTGPGRDAGIRVYSYQDAPVDVRFDNFAASKP